jgi:hypothetical protein
MDMGVKKLVAVAIAAVIGSAAFAPGAQAADISFDGYCDGMRMSFKAVPGDDPTVQGKSIGCVSSGVIGLAKPTATGRYSVRGTEFLMSADYNASGLTAHWVINRNHTWAAYGESGGVIALLNSGTWSDGPPARGASRSTALAGASILGAPDVGITATRNIKFDSFCDGMALNKPSAGLGTNTTIDGNVTGSCVTNDPLIGSYSPQFSGGVNSYIVIVPAIDFLYRINLNHTFANYVPSGNNSQIISPVYTGTWSNGAPARAGVASSR